MCFADLTSAACLFTRTHKGSAPTRLPQSSFIWCYEGTAQTAAAHSPAGHSLAPPTTRVTGKLWGIVQPVLSYSAKKAEYRTVLYCRLKKVNGGCWETERFCQPQGSTAQWDQEASCTHGRIPDTHARRCSNVSLSSHKFHLPPH